MNNEQSLKRGMTTLRKQTTILELIFVYSIGPFHKAVLCGILLNLSVNENIRQENLGIMRTDNMDVLV